MCNTKNLIYQGNIMVHLKTFKNICLLLLVGLLAISFAEGKKKSAPVFKSRDLKGKLVESQKLYESGPSIVFFWHSCCGLDKAQLKAMKNFYTQYSDKGLEIIGIAVDGASKTAKVKKAVNLFKMSWVSVVDKNNAIKDKFGPTALPTVYIISKGGKILSTFGGFTLGDDKKMKEIVDPLFDS